MDKNNERPIYDLFEHCASLIHKKGSDYSDMRDWHSNFRYAEELIDPFPLRYKPYVVLIAVKLARLSQLLPRGARDVTDEIAGIPQDRGVQNEPIEDSFVDLVNFCALMGERYMLEKGKSNA